MRGRRDARSKSASYPYVAKRTETLGNQAHPHLLESAPLMELRRKSLPRDRRISDLKHSIKRQQ